MRCDGPRILNLILDLALQTPGGVWCRDRWIFLKHFKQMAESAGTVQGVVERSSQEAVGEGP